ncbi:MAG TPA: L-serine ammonia-lyase, partial [Chitinophagaceae bacterium]|nr:L-serine ammonia-lyase [Chitinophagaceae bacterium]
MPHEAISVFDMFKIGVGPSSSHTLGPWRAALQCIEHLRTTQLINQVQHIQVLLYGSLAKTGKGHGTDIAVLLGLAGEDPVTIDVNTITPTIEALQQTHQMLLGKTHNITLNPATDVVFLMNESLPFHPNGMTFLVQLQNGEAIAQTYYSIGGGFVVQEATNNQTTSPTVELPFPINTANDLLHWCMK